MGASRLRRIRRTRSACPNWLPSSRSRSRPTRSRLRKLRRLPPSTWPSSGRHSRSSRRLRSDQRWLKLNSLLLALFSKQYHLIRKDDLICFFIPLSPLPCPCKIKRIKKKKSEKKKVFLFLKKKKKKKKKK